jgi:hypothetical protein
MSNTLQHSFSKMTIMSEIDFNKLVKDIVSAARGEATANLCKVRSVDDDDKLSITLKLEVTISKNSNKRYQANQKSSRRLVLLTINDHE